MDEEYDERPETPVDPPQIIDPVNPPGPGGDEEDRDPDDLDEFVDYAGEGDGEDEEDPWLVAYPFGPPAELMGGIKASITATSWTDSTVTLKITPGSGYDQFRVYVRTGRAADGTGDAVFDQRYYKTSTFYVTVRNLSAGTWYAYNVCSINTTTWDSGWYGGQDFQTDAAPVGPTRPSNWSWWSSIYSGAVMATAQNGKLIGTITAAEWRAFCARINEFRDYVGLSQYSFTSPTSRTTAMSAAIVNEARTAIYAMSPPTSPPAAARKNQTAITAAFFNGLKNSLNSIT